MKSADFTIYDLTARNAALYAHREAVVGGGDRLTFGAFHRHCAGFAAGLRGQGLAAGDRIAVVAGNAEEFLLLCVAAARVGAIVVPVNWRLDAAEIAYILTDTTPRFLFCSREYEELARQAAAGMSFLAKRFVFGNGECAGAGMASRTAPGVRRSVSPGGGENDVGATPSAGAGVPDGDDFHPWPAENGASGEGGTVRIASAEEDFAHPGGADPFLIIHTAAVGGKPRGCVLSQDNLLAAAVQIVQLLRLDSRDAYVGLLPLFHIGGLAMTLATMLAGGKNVLVPRFDPPAVLRLTAAEEGTFFVTFPPMLGALLDTAEKGDFQANRLRLACGVDAPETIARFQQMHPRADFFSLYGQTEAMPVSGGNYRERPGSIGRPALLTRVALCDDLDEEVLPGTAGEICVHSPAVFRGYWNLPEETAAAARNGWHRTGDLGRRDEEGFLWYAGRKPEKELIKTGGENVYPVEVEKAILAHAAIAEACVIGVPDPEWGEAVQAVCVLREGAQVSAGELGEFTAARIARYKKPKHIVFVAALPKTPAGNIDREAVKRTWGKNS